MTEATDALAALHTRLIDACEGYEKGRELAEDPAMIALFEDMLAMHRAHAAELAEALVARGVAPDDDGSFLQYVHKAVLTVRSAVSGLGENVIPGLRDGEDRILELYDETLSRVASEPELVQLVERQRAVVASRALRLESMGRAAEA